MAILSKLKPPKGSRRKRRRVGRGPGSNLGKTAGLGMNGQRSRSGSGGMRYFEGGQMPLQRRVPKRGFVNPCAKVVANIDVAALAAFDTGSEVTIDALCERGLLKGKFDVLKVLGTGDLDKQLTVFAHGFSQGARNKIEAAGGRAEIVEPTTAKKKADEATEG